jgi:hypothetical protein
MLLISSQNSWRVVASSSKKEKRGKLGMIFDFWWAIWKERTGEFESKERSHHQLFSTVKDDIFSHLNHLSHYALSVT